MKIADVVKVQTPTCAVILSANFGINDMILTMGLNNEKLSRVTVRVNINIKPRAFWLRPIVRPESLLCQTHEQLPTLYNPEHHQFELFHFFRWFWQSIIHVWCAQSATTNQLRLRLGREWKLKCQLLSRWPSNLNCTYSVSCHHFLSNLFQLHFHTRVDLFSFFQRILNDFAPELATVVSHLSEIIHSP